jgi:VIT1/CCC1 family predicted Fe2+/Mn2+ transporter
METKVKLAVSLTQREIDFVNILMEKHQTSFSGALRMIIEDFISTEQQRERINKSRK